MSQIHFGIAGWSYTDWESVVYPPGLPKSDQLPYLAQFFDIIELNNTFYRIPESKMIESWITKVQPYPGFRFTAKLWEGFTHKSDTIQGSEAGRFQEVMKPMLDAGRLGALLIQFPISFRMSPENVDYVKLLGGRFRTFHPVVEFRHRSWIREEVFRFLEEEQLGFCNVDEPVFRQMVKPSSLVIGKVGYLRLHGRNYEKWFNKEGSRNARYDYLYPESELDEWIPKIHQMGEKAENLYIVGNNHFRGQAPANVLQLKSKTIRGPVAVPDALAEAYPELQSIARKGGIRKPQQKKLF